MEDPSIDVPLYVRIGINYYKNIKLPTILGTDYNILLVPWSKQTIKDDHGADYLATIPHFDAIVTVPDHQNYKRRIGNCYNDYHPLSHTPTPGAIIASQEYLRHIFQEQYEQALDFLAIFYRYPTQMLPVLCLVSNERNTGKTTFLKWLKLIFGRNFTLNSNEDLRSRFNADWVNKIGIGVDETFLEKKEDSEKLKNLSTANVVKREAKGIDKIETPFFAKFILCSNNETGFLYVDPEEIRYWVIKVPTFEQENIDLLSQLESEIPAFLHFLMTREISCPRKSRMWFAPEDIWTPALQKLKDENASTVEKEIREIIVDSLLTHNTEKICFTVTDLLEELKKSNIRSVNRNYIGKILKEKWGLQQVKNASTYQRYSCFGERISSETYQGRYYTFRRKDFITNADADDSDQQKS